MDMTRDYIDTYSFARSSYPIFISQVCNRRPVKYKVVVLLMEDETMENI